MILNPPPGPMAPAVPWRLPLIWMRTASCTLTITPAPIRAWPRCRCCATAPKWPCPASGGCIEQFGMRQTFFLPAWCMERYPASVEAILKDGHEIGHHGYLHERPNELPTGRGVVLATTRHRGDRQVRANAGVSLPAFIKFSRHTFGFFGAGRFRLRMPRCLATMCPICWRTGRGRSSSCPVITPWTIGRTSWRRGILAT